VSVRIVASEDLPSRTLQKKHMSFFSNFSEAYVCPEPVLANVRVLA
jgi:hypothetical protein